MAEEVPGNRTLLSGTTLVPAMLAPESDPGVLAGRVWDDSNANGVQDAGEAGLAGWAVFLDQSGNGSLDSGEPSTITDAGGEYQFAGLTAGTYTVVQVMPDGWKQTFGGSTRDLFQADFSDALGQPADDGFTSSGPADQWHLSTGRDADAGHFTGGSFYFGSGEGPAGEGAYQEEGDGTLTSPLIDLRGVRAPIALSFNHFLQVEEAYDYAGVSVLAGGVETVLARQFWPVRLPVETEGFRIRPLGPFRVRGPGDSNRVPSSVRLECFLRGLVR